MEFPLDYSDVMVVIIVTIIASIAVRRGYKTSLKKIITIVDRAADGNIDIRIDMPRHDSLGDLCEKIDILLARRASESAELKGRTEEHERRELDFRRLVRAGCLISAGANRESALHEATSFLFRRVKAEHLLIYLSSTATLDSVAYLFSADKKPVVLKKERPDGFIRHVIGSGESVICNNVSFDDRYNEERYVDELCIGAKELLCVPLIGGERITGAMELIGKKEKFGAYDQEYAETIALFTGAKLSSFN